MVVESNYMISRRRNDVRYSWEKKGERTINIMRFGKQRIFKKVRRFKKAGSDESREKNLRSSSSQHLMPLGLREHTNRHTEEQCEHHHQQNLQFTMLIYKEEYRGRAHNQTHNHQRQNDASDEIGAVFADKQEILVVVSLEALV